MAFARGAGRRTGSVPVLGRPEENASACRSVARYYLLLGTGLAVPLGQVFWIQHQVASGGRRTWRNLGRELRVQNQLDFARRRRALVCRWRSGLRQLPWRSLPKSAVLEDAADYFFLSRLDETDHPHLAAALVAFQRINFPHPLDQSGPAAPCRRRVASVLAASSSSRSTVTPSLPSCAARRPRWRCEYQP